MNLERRQAFSIFAARLLEQRVLQSYQGFEARKQALRMYHGDQDRHGPRVPIASLPTMIKIIDPREVEVDYTVPANTGGAFCDLFCGRHLRLGKVALKRLRTDMSKSGHIPVRSLTLTRALVLDICLSLRQHFLGEVQLWQSLSHPHLLPFLGVLFDDRISLVSPFVENGSLPEYLLKHPDSNYVKFVSMHISLNRNFPDIVHL